MRLRILLAALCAFAGAGCAGKIVVSKVPATSPAPMEGMYYTLPKTVVKVDQPIERVARQAGKYVVYLPLFFPKISAVGAFVPASGAKYNVNKSAVSTYGEPDSENIYYLKLSGNGPVDRTGLFEYTEQGTVSGVASQADNVTTDIILSAIGTAVSLASKSFGADADQVAKATKDLVCGKESREIPCKIKNLINTSSIDTERLLASWAGLTSEQQNTMQAAANGTTTRFDDALLSYAEIFTLREERNLIRKTAASFSADAAMKDFDTAIANELTSSFTGTEKKDTWTFSTNLRDYKAGQSIPLLKVHRSEGLCSVEPLPAGDRPPPAFWFVGASYRCDETTIRTALQDQLKEINAQTPVDQEVLGRVQKKLNDLTKTLADAKPLSASVAPDPTAGQPFQRIATATQAGDRGFYYRIPATANVILQLGDDPLTISKQSIAQFGFLASLPASVGGRSTAYTLKFYEATGALKSLNLTSKAVLTRGTADAIGANANTLVDARSKADDELTKLDHDSKVLANKVSIYNSCKTLNIACGGFVPAATVPQP
jgi:uncharacterized coiled-coil protein SlyX